MSSLRQFCQIFGLHPFVAFGMFAVDAMLFVPEIATAGISWPISIPIAGVLAFGCIFVQKYSYKDEWGAAIGKSILIGLLTAIPTALPAILTLGGGVIGSAKMLLPKQDQYDD